MKPVTNFLVAFGFLLPWLSISKDAEIKTRSASISFYQVQLVCPAAPHIGCGSASKPVLLKLERDPGINEAWLNRSGTVLAVVWKQNNSSRARQKVVSSFLEREKVREIKGEARAQTLKSFQSGTGWYRGAEVDRLSEEEAEIMAGRLVRRMQKLIKITDEEGRVLLDEFSPVLARKLTQGEPLEQTESALMKICQEHLNEKDIAVLHEAHQKGAFSNLRTE